MALTVAQGVPCGGTARGERDLEMRLYEDFKVAVERRRDGPFPVRLRVGLDSRAALGVYELRGNLRVNVLP